MYLGDVTLGARGCSMILALRMLAEINPEFAKKQFALFTESFITTTFGLPSVREYPKGNNGSGDIDSGPVIFGVGFSATIVSIGTLSMYGNGSLADIQYKTINAFGFSRKSKKQKKYLMGKLPIADGFIAWGRATSLNNSTGELIFNSIKWTLEFNLISFSVILVLWMIFFKKKIMKKIKKSH